MIRPLRLLILVLLLCVPLIAQENTTPPPADDIPSLDEEETDSVTETDTPAPEEESPEGPKSDTSSDSDDSSSEEYDPLSDEAMSAEEPAPNSTNGTQDEEAESAVPKERESPDVFKGSTEKKKGADYYYTYLGGMLNLGGSNIWYSDWVGDVQQENECSAITAAPMVTCLLMAPPFIGQADLGFRFNFSDDSYATFFHTTMDTKLKYSYEVVRRLSVCGGLGFYFEFAPASETYRGAGLLVPLGGFYELSSSMILLLDIDLGVGNYGKGTESGKFSYGISAGAAYKMGNL